MLTQLISKELNSLFRNVHYFYNDEYNMWEFVVIDTDEYFEKEDEIINITKQIKDYKYLIDYIITVDVAYKYQHLSKQ